MLEVQPGPLQQIQEPVGASVRLRGERKGLAVEKDMPLGRDGSLGRRLPGRERRRRRRCIHALQTIPRLQHRMPLQEAPFTLNGLAPQLGTELRGGHDAVFAGLGRGKVNTVAGMNQCRRGGFRTVDGKLGGDGGGAIEHIAPPVYPKQQAFAAAADEIGIAVPIHHQQLQQDRKSVV